jgi:methionyl-tRNA formyltransferase
MRTILFSWCGATERTSRALAEAGAAPVLVVERTSSAEERDPSFVRRLETLSADLIVVAGWGRILARDVLDAARFGGVNIHPSLLPSYRGRNPIFWTLRQGEPQTGVTIHRMTEDVDQGPILLQRAFPILPRATSATLRRDLDELGAELLTELVRDVPERGLPAGRLATEPGSAFPPLKADDGRIDWTRSALAIDRLVRACDGELEAFTLFGSLRLVLLDAQPVPSGWGVPPAASAMSGGPAAAPGTIIGMAGDALVVTTGDGLLATSRWAAKGRVRAGTELISALGLRVGDRF